MWRDVQTWSIGIPQQWSHPNNCQPNPGYLLWGTGIILIWKYTVFYSKFSIGKKYHIELRMTFIQVSMSQTSFILVHVCDEINVSIIATMSLNSNTKQLLYNGNGFRGWGRFVSTVITLSDSRQVNSQTLQSLVILNVVAWFITEPLKYQLILN